MINTTQGVCIKSLWFTDGRVVSGPGQICSWEQCGGSEPAGSAVAESAAGTLALCRYTLTVVFPCPLLSLSPSPSSLFLVDGPEVL